MAEIDFEAEFNESSMLIESPDWTRMEGVQGVHLTGKIMRLPNPLVLRQPVPGGGLIRYVQVDSLSQATDGIDPHLMMPARLAAADFTIDIPVGKRARVMVGRHDMNQAKSEMRTNVLPNAVRGLDAGANALESGAMIAVLAGGALPAAASAGIIIGIAGLAVGAQYAQDKMAYNRKKRYFVRVCDQNYKAPGERIYKSDLLPATVRQLNSHDLFNFVLANYKKAKFSRKYLDALVGVVGNNPPPALYYR